MNAHDIRKLTSEQIKDEITSARRKIFDLRAQAVTEKVANVSQFPTLRRTIARLLTEQGSRVRAANPAPVKKIIRGLSKEGREMLIAKPVDPSVFSKRSGAKPSDAGQATSPAATKVKAPRKSKVKS